MIADEDRIEVEILATPREYGHYLNCIRIISNVMFRSEIKVRQIQWYANSIFRQPIEGVPI